MNSYLWLTLAAERAKDLESAAVVEGYRREARKARRAARAARRQRQALHGSQVRHGSQVPDSYEDFLCQTAQSAMREPTATGRSRGQAVR